MEWGSLRPQKAEGRGIAQGYLNLALILIFPPLYHQSKYLESWMFVNIPLQNAYNY